MWPPPPGPPPNTEAPGLATRRLALAPLLLSGSGLALLCAALGLLSWVFSLSDFRAVIVFGNLIAAVFVGSALMSLAGTVAAIAAPSWRCAWD